MASIALSSVSRSSADTYKAVDEKRGNPARDLGTETLVQTLVTETSVSELISPEACAVSGETLRSSEYAAPWTRKPNAKEVHEHVRASTPRGVASTVELTKDSADQPAPRVTALLGASDAVREAEHVRNVART